MAISKIGETATYIHRRSQPKIQTNLKQLCMVMKLTEKDTVKKEGGVLSRLRSMGGQDCGCGCCGGVKIVPKEKKAEEKE